MGRASQLPVFHLRAGVIKRVVRQSDRFVCGLCRNAHPKEEEAMGCVESCWEEVLTLAPVLRRRRAQGFFYRCRFCARDHSDHGGAARCAADCRDKQVQSFSDARAIDARDDKVATPRLRHARRAPVGAPLRAVLPRRGRIKSQLLTKPEAVEPKPSATVRGGEDEPAAEPMAGDAAEREPAVGPAVAAAAEAAAKTKKKPAEIFYRDGAKYACTVCHARHFTRLEVTNCYEAH